MFRFEHPEHLYALLVIPLLILFFVASRLHRRRALSRFGDLQLMSQIAPDMSKYKHTLKFVLLVIGMAILVIGWANPQWGSKKETVTRKGIDLFIALDISQSMLAEDISPSRLERAKRFGQNLVEGLKGENIGVILFACNAYLQVPLTVDYSFADLFLRTANTGMAPSQGTSLAEAIQLAQQSFPEENERNKALVIISDGEEHDGAAAAVAAEAKDNGLTIFTVGIGDPGGSFIPTQVAGRQDYKRDNAGNPIRSSLNEAALQEVAEAGNGIYFNLAGRDQEIIRALRERIDQIEKQEFEQQSFTDYASYFQIFIALGLVLLILEFIISYRKSRYLADKDIFA
jgi:Ca-activated chloride channel family protein